ncbi:PREDICTED: angiopoietin-related protein 2-like [Bactrocera latifrons]|uniref:angiopoietin-related protein 2-like n=1 Tax=Bactrocera latifrons TaxID=174628 RepID=UPI0008DE8411|nr:PREDICTED: angiopoietin-related protein 2-like [Bactrocera latifrons]
MFRFVFIILTHCVLLFQIRFCVGKDNDTSKVCDCNCNCVMNIGSAIKNLNGGLNNTEANSVLFGNSNSTPNQDRLLVSSTSTPNEDRLLGISTSTPTTHHLLASSASTPSSCMEAAANNLKNGVYKIQIEKYNIKDLEVFCEEDIDFGGWIVILRRKSETINFYRKWEDYKKGFGDITGDYWIGLENMYALTNSCEQELYVYIKRLSGKVYFAKYSEFRIGNESESYALERLGKYSGNAGDSLKKHLGKKFSTHDRDNDDSERNCAKVHRGAWWFHKCYNSHLNGVYPRGKYGVNWNNLRKEEPLLYAQMMIRPTPNLWRQLTLSNDFACI